MGGGLMLYAFYLHTRWGLCDRSGNVVVYPKFSVLFPQNYGEDFICGRWEFGTAYMSESGRIEASIGAFGDRFTEGLARFSIHESWGFMNKDFKVAIEPMFDEAKPFSEGLAAVRLGEKWGYINQKGEIVINPVFDVVHEDFLRCEPVNGCKSYFKEGFACVGVDDKWGFTDRFGKILSNTLYDDADGFNMGLAPVKVNGKWGYIDKEGKFAIDPQYGWAGCFINGFAKVYMGKSKWLDGDMEDDSEDETEQITEKEEMEEVKRTNTLWTFIDTKGKPICENYFDAIGVFEDGVAPAELDGLWGVIDTKGKFVVKPKYGIIYDFEQDGVALAKRNEDFGLIDKENGYKFTKIDISHNSKGDFQEFDYGKVVIWKA